MRTLICVVMVCLLSIVPGNGFALSKDFEGQKRHVWNIAKIRAQGNEFLINIFPPSDPRRQRIKEAILAGELRINLGELTKQEIDILCDYREFLKNEGELIASCPERHTMGTGVPAPPLDLDSVNKILDKVETAIPKRGPLFWNVWAEDFKKRKAEIPPVYLKPKTSYFINVHFSGFPYPFVLSQTGSHGFSEIVKEAIKFEDDTMTLKAVLMPDPQFFQTESKILGDLEIDLKAISRHWKKGSLTVPNIWADLKDPRNSAGKKIDKPEYVFGRLKKFKITTKAGVEGKTAIGISFWMGERPVEVFSVPFWVGDNLPPKAKENFEIRMDKSGFLSIAGEDSSNLTKPDASMLIIELSENKILGLLKINDDNNNENYLTWPISRNSIEFKDHLNHTMGSLRNEASDSLVILGKGLMNAIFPKGFLDDETEEDAKRIKIAKETLMKFIAKNETEKPFEESQPKTIFVKTILNDFTQPILFPMGLINYGDTKNSLTKFIGYHFQMEYPLPLQKYAENDKECIDSWKAILPFQETGDSELDQAYVQIAGRFMAKKTSGVRYYNLAKNKQIEAFISTSQFNKSVLGVNLAEDSLVLPIISHHGENVLKLGDSEITPFNIRMDISKPSVAFLLGCSTINIGSKGIIRALNRNNFDGFIATNVGITGTLAGDFMVCLSEVIENNKSNSIALGDLFYLSQKCLYEKTKEKEYGPQVLSFSLLGNPSIKICTN